MEGNSQVSQEKKTFKNLLQQFLHQVKKTIGQGRSENNQSSAAYFGNVPARGGFTLRTTFCPRMEPVVWRRITCRANCVSGWLVASSVGTWKRVQKKKSF